MHIFITGANSFVGSKLREQCRELNIDYSGVDIAGPFTKEIVEADLRSEALVDLIPKRSVVVHLAAISRDSDCDTDPDNAMSINLGGTANVMNAAIEAHASRAIFASSEWVYGRSPSVGPLTEGMGPAWADLDSLYAFSKAAGEQIVFAAASRVPVSVLRLGIVYGPRSSNWSAFEYVVNSTIAGEVAIGSAETSRRFIHVGDVSSGILAAAKESSDQSHIWNLSGPSSLSLGEIAETAATLLGSAVKINESSPGEPSIRNPIPDLMQDETSWRPQWDTIGGVGDVLTFLANNFQQDARR